MQTANTRSTRSVNRVSRQARRPREFDDPIYVHYIINFNEFIIGSCFDQSVGWGGGRSSSILW